MTLKKQGIICFIITALFINGCGGVLPQNNPTNQQNEERGSTNTELLVKRKISSLENTGSKKALILKNKLKSIKPLGVEVIKVPDGISVKDYIKELAKDPTIEYVEPNYIRKITLSEESFAENSKFDLQDYLAQKIKPSVVKTASRMFNDPDMKLQYGLDNINADKAWSTTTGNSEVIIAVVDTGVDLSHPDLQENLVNGYSTVKGTSSPNDDNGHGTHVAGIVAALSNNSRGVAGLAPKCKVMPIKVLSAKGDGNDSDIAEGVVWAVDHGAKIINLSLGGSGAGRTLENAMLYAYNSNVLVIAAMGNNGKKVKTYPAAFKNIIAVGATDIKNKIAPFSNYGEWISVSAPGLKIHSTFPTYKVELSRYNLSSSYAVLSGTSMAVPFVAGLAALIMSKNKDLNRAEVRKKIETGCNDIESPGFDEFSGAGLIDASKALNSR